MKKLSWVILALCMVMAFQTVALASNEIGVGYFSSNGNSNLSFSGKLDITSRSSISAKYTMLENKNFEVDAEYKMALLNSELSLGPIIEGQLKRENDTNSYSYGGGVFVETSAKNGLGLYGKAVYRTNAENTESGFLAGVGAKFKVADPIFIAAEATMGIAGDYNDSQIGLKLGYQF